MSGISISISMMKACSAAASSWEPWKRMNQNMVVLYLEDPRTGLARSTGRFSEENGICFLPS